MSSRTHRRADRVWLEADLADKLRLHQARHAYASFMFDLYGHRMPGAESEEAALLDALGAG